MVKFRKIKVKSIENEEIIMINDNDNDKNNSKNNHNNNYENENKDWHKFIRKKNIGINIKI